MAFSERVQNLMSTIVQEWDAMEPLDDDLIEWYLDDELSNEGFRLTPTLKVKVIQQLKLDIEKKRDYATESSLEKEETGEIDV